MLKNSYLVHGYLARPQSHWFPWLTEKLGEKSISLDILEMPDSNQPIYKNWANFLDVSLSPIHSETTLIGHSLGCITLLDYLSRHPTKIKNLILVAGFNKDLKQTPALSEFIQSCHINYEQIIKNTESITVFYSNNDYLVDSDITINLAKMLNAKCIEMTNHGHFLDKDGIMDFPKILDYITT